MDGGFPIDLIFFAMIAVFLILRLRSVLGRRTGHERPPDHVAYERTNDKANDDNVVALPDRGDGDAMESTPLEAGLAQIRVTDRAFDPEEFVVGARVAFEMVVAAFAKGEKEALRPLLSDEVYDNFTNAIDARENRGESLETTLVGIKESNIIEARLDSRVAFVTVRFVTEQINVTRDIGNKVVDGDPDHVTKITDIWTFARNTRSRDPNWTLVETGSEN
ncbi:MAG: Tim44 domain-containing protein [Alphaproteobacteria bacterium]|nr:Tim44 domain-containing protein [Alphaproteobacteria bacterium]